MESHLLDQFAALAHPQRLQLFRLLVRRYPDALPAGEVCAVLGFKPSTTSVYLSALARAGLIRQARAGTSLRYSADLDGIDGMLGALVHDCCRGRPDLCLQSAVEDARPQPRLSVLFLCTGNSARSIMAEALLRHAAGDRFAAHSAGTHPRAAPDPRALAALRARGIDTGGLRSKPVAEYRRADAPRFDLVVTVCDLAANEECPAWPGQPVATHWGLPDPSRQTGHAAFHRTCDDLTRRIGALAALPGDPRDRAAFQHHADEIGRMETLA